MGNWDTVSSGVVAVTLGKISGIITFNKSERDSGWSRRHMVDIRNSWEILWWPRNDAVGRVLEIPR